MPRLGQDLPADVTARALALIERPAAITAADTAFLAPIAEDLMREQRPTFSFRQFAALFTAIGRQGEIPDGGTLDQPPTPEAVKRYPVFFIVGPGRAAAQATDCGHGYRLTDSCSCCP